MKYHHFNVLNHDPLQNQMPDHLWGVLTSSQLWCEHVTHFLDVKNLQENSV
jgi:hypothetical protein